MNDSVSVATPAHLGLRLIAMVYDLLPLLALWFVASVLALVLTGGQLDVHRLSDKLLVQALILGLSAAYFVMSWRRGGQTVGMRPWHLRVVNLAGERISFGQALLRFAVSIVSWSTLGAGFWWSLIDRENRTWHDAASRTRLVRLASGQKTR